MNIYNIIFMETLRKLYYLDSEGADSFSEGDKKNNLTDLELHPLKVY